MVTELQLTGRIGKRTVNYLGEKITSGEVLRDLLRKWHNQFMKVIDIMILKKVSEAVISSSESRIGISKTVYNFTGTEVAEEEMKGLNLGSNYVVHTKMAETEARKKLNEELLLYLRKYRRFIEKKNEILEIDVLSWLEKAVEDSMDNDEHQEFYSSVLRSLSVGLGVGKRVNDGFKVNFNKFDQLGICIVEADKNVGICLVNISDMLEADERMVEELGGQSTGVKTAEDVKDEIHDKILEFENSNDENSQKYLNRYCGDRWEEFETSELPYLKNRPKIHKLTPEQLEKRDPKLLKYRPVVDASRTPLNSYAKMLTGYLRDLMRRVESKYFGEESPFIKNGQHFANIFKSHEMNTSEQKYFAIADLSSAYTYVYLENLIVAMKYFGKVLGIPTWKVKLFEKMATLVFTNSFLETTKGVYKLNTCLPMGLCCSGECMDIVLLLCEMVFLGKAKAEDAEGFVEQYGNYKLLSHREPGASFLKYKRYRDDTFSCIRYETGAPKRDIENLGSTFLPSLDINVELSIFVGSFLDVMFFKKFSAEGYETMLKRKGKFPITFCHGSSNMSSSIVRSILAGELLRHRRLCSNEKLVQVNDECITKELISRGYKEGFIRKSVDFRISQITRMYDQNLQLRNSKEVPEGLVYGAKTIYDEEWLTHEKLRLILRIALPEGIK